MMPASTPRFGVKAGIGMAVFVLACVGGITVGSSTASAARRQDEPQVVRVGIFVENLSDVDPKTGSFQADFYLWFRWRGEIDPTLSYQFTNGIQQELNTRAGVTDDDGKPVPEELADGWRYQIYRVTGRFLAHFDVGDYPFDDAQLVISVEDFWYTAHQLAYETDKRSGMARHVDVAGWHIKPPVARVTNYFYPTDFGYPEDPDLTYSRVNFTLDANRPGMRLALQSIFPLAVVIFAAFAALVIATPLGASSDDHWWWLAARLSLAVPALIAAVALQLTAAQGIPREGEVLLIDRVYLVSYILILAVIGVTVFAHRLARQGKSDQTAKIERQALSVLVPTFLGAVTLVLLLH